MEWPLITMLCCCIVALVTAIFHGIYMLELKKIVNALKNIANQCEDCETKKALTSEIETIEMKLL